MAVSQASIGYGTRFLIANVGESPGMSPESVDYTDIAEVKNITPPNAQTDQVDVSHNQSPNRRREFIAGLIDPGEASFEMNFVPGSTSDARIRTLQTSGEVVPMRIIFPNLSRWTFNASVSGYEISSTTEDAMTATVTLRTTGDTVVT